MSADRAFRARYGPWALVAGAAMGLGAEFARQLAERGLALVLLDREAAALEATAASIAAAHAVTVRPVVVDLGRPDLVEALAGSIAGLEIGLLVYNAALGTVAPFLALDPSHTERMLDVNCRAPLRLLHALAPPMVTRGRGGIVLMSSLAGSFGSAQLAVYAATKAFALVLADALWVELGEHGVDVLAARGPYRGRPAGDGARGRGAGGARGDRHGAPSRRRRGEPESGRGLPAPRAPAGGRGDEPNYARAAAELPPRRRLSGQPAA